MKIKSCRSCQSKNLINIISLGNLYLSNFRSDNKKPPKYPLDLILCKKCFLLQLRHNTPMNLLYTENYGYKSGINKTMQDELKEIATKTYKTLGKRKEQILAIDIGANDGTLIKNYPKNVFTVGIEPIKKLAKECSQHANVIVNDFFNFESYEKKLGKRQADIITAISCFYDMEDPNKFVFDITKMLKDDGIFVIQQNYLKSMLKLNAFDNIVHEHLEYYSMISLGNLLDKHGLEIFNVTQDNLNGGSFRTFIAFKNKRKISKTVLELIKIERKDGLNKVKTYKEFAKRINKNSEKTLDFIKKMHLKGKKIYIYGASTRGNTLIQHIKLDNKLITAAVERNPEKWGMKISSLQIPIVSEEKARKEKPEFMLVLPWFFKKEFLQREKAYLKQGGHFIFPLPKFEVI